MQRGDCGRPGEIPEVLRRVPGEAGPVQRCRRQVGIYKVLQNRCLLVVIHIMSTTSILLPFMAAG